MLEDHLKSPLQTLLDAMIGLVPSGAAMQILEPMPRFCAHLAVCILLAIVTRWVHQLEPRLALHPVLPAILYLSNPATLASIAGTASTSRSKESLPTIGLIALLLAQWTASRRQIYRPALLAGFCLGVYHCAFQSFHGFALAIPLAALQRHQKLKKHIADFEKVAGRDILGIGVLSLIILTTSLCTIVGIQALAYLLVARESTSFKTYLADDVKLSWSHHYHEPSHAMTWYLGLAMLDNAKAFYLLFINLSIVAQSVPLSFLWLRQPHLLTWVLCGALPLFEKFVPGYVIAYALASMFIFGVIPLNNKLVTMACVVANMSLWIGRMLDLTWRKYNSSNSHIAYIGLAGPTIGMCCCWIWCYTTAHTLVFKRLKRDTISS